MKVSVIIPCYNGAAYLPACMESVLAQTMPDFEAILVDDGSRDNTLALAQAIAEKDPRVRVYHQENAGVSAARNLGLEHACGEWITFVDSDDLLLEDALETMLSAVSDEIDMVVCAHRTFAADGTGETVIPETRWMDLCGEAKRRAAALRLIEGDCVLNIMCNKLHRRALIEREHIRLDPNVRIAEDALFNLEAVLLGRGIAYVNKVAYLYRTHDASAMHTPSSGEFERHLPWMRALSALLARLGKMEEYYAAYLDTVVLRLYKDGGVGGVVRGFAGKAWPLVRRDDLRAREMRCGTRLLYALVHAGAYPVCYPLIYPVQVIKRKIGEASFALRAKKEMPE